VVNESGNTLTGSYTFSESATQGYTFTETESKSSGFGPGSSTSSFSLLENGHNAYTVTQSGNHVTGVYSLYQSGTDSFTVAETGGTSSSGGGGGGGGGSSSGSGSSSTWGLTLSGADSYSTHEVGNELSGLFNRTTSGGGSDMLSESGSIAGLPYNSTPSTGYTLSETGNDLSGELSLTETGSDRYSLIYQFDNASNAVLSNGNGPGDVDYSPVGVPFHVGQSPYWGHGVNANLGAAASDAAFSELGLGLLHEYCWAGDQAFMANSEDDQPIESAREGQTVLSASEHDPEGPRHENAILKFFRNEPAHVINLYIEGRLFRPTLNHPIYARGRGFVPAAELYPGDELLTDDHRWVKVSSIVDKGEVVPVFNLMVANDHTYFVGSKRIGGFCILVHNESPGAGGRRQGTSTYDRQQAWVGVLFHTEQELRDMGVDEFFIRLWKNQGWKFGQDGIEAALGLQAGKYDVREETVTAADGTTAKVLEIRDRLTGNRWFALPQEMNLNGKVVGVGYTFFKNWGDVEYNLSGGERLKALQKLLPVYGLGAGSVATKQMMKAVGNLLKNAANKLMPIPEYNFGSPLSARQAGKAARAMGRRAGTVAPASNSNGRNGTPAHQSDVNANNRQVSGDLEPRPVGGRVPDGVGQQGQVVTIRGKTIDPGPNGRVIVESEEFTNAGMPVSGGREQIRDIRAGDPSATIVVTDPNNPARPPTVYPPGTQPPPKGRLPQGTPPSVPYP
jgi:hypothetical protein